MSAPALLEVCNLIRDYPAGPAPLFGRRATVRALDGIDLQVPQGSIFGIVGESGCGKSTLARIVMALDRPTSGNVLFDGDDLFLLPPARLAARRRDFQMVFQDPYGSLDPRSRIGRTIAEPLHVVPGAPRGKARAELVGRALESVGLKAADATRFPHEFSGGQRQRIAIARALITEPKLVVADEAVSALDLSVQAQVLNLLRALRDRRGITVLFISHNLAVIDCVADHVAVMYRGRIVARGAAGGVCDQPLHPYTQLLIAAEPSLDQIGRGPRRPRPPVAPKVSAVAGQSCAFLPRCPRATERCAAEAPPLRAIADGRASACHHAEDLSPSLVP